jgi:hypothetical protein
MGVGVLVGSNAPGAWCCLPTPIEGVVKHEQSYTSTPPPPPISVMLKGDLHLLVLCVVLTFYFRVYERIVALTGLSVYEDT